MTEINPISSAIADVELEIERVTKLYIEQMETVETYSFFDGKHRITLIHLMEVLKKLKEVQNGGK